MQIGKSVRAIIVEPVDLPPHLPAAEPQPEQTPASDTKPERCTAQRMRIPDYISPIVACRVWKLDNQGLKSLNGQIWNPGRALAAECELSEPTTLLGRSGAMHGAHEVPAADCTCGVYAAKSLAHVRRLGYDSYGFCGEVYLWGTVVEHARGWRAQYAYPKNFVLNLEMMPHSMVSVEARMAILAAYGCDISIISKGGIVPLWSKASGYNATGFELLLERCQVWYARRQQEREVEPGDRVAILGRGIGVVQESDGQHVQAVLGHRKALRLARKDIVWHQGNLRWEATPSGTSQEQLAMSWA